MEIFKKSDFEKLAGTHSPNCVSIFIPTHRTNASGDGMYKDRTTLKNQLKEANQQLQTFDLKESEADAHLKPIEKLLDDDQFWRKQSDGLAIFYDGEDLHTFPVPKVFEEYTYVNSHFYLKPMADLLHGSGRHFILAISMGEVSFYEATRTTISDVKIEDLVPMEMEEAVGGDYEDKSLQRRSGQGEEGDSQGIFHGHGEGNESEKKQEALKFFKQVNDGLMKMLYDEDAPMVVACVDYLYPIYEEANTYPHLRKDHVSGNFEHADLLELKEKAWDIVKEDFDKEREEAKSRFDALQNEGKSAASPDEVIPASMIGRAETLFLQKDEEIWGKYHEDTNKIEINEVRKVGDAGLLNLAAIETVKHGGKVYIVSADDMPASDSPANAVFRYEM